MRSAIREGRCRTGGFTLIEILLVVLLLSCIAVLALPQGELAFRQVKLRTAASDMAYLVRYAQGKAALDRCPIRLEFDEDVRTYRLLRPVNAEVRSFGETLFERLPGRWGRTFVIPEGVTVESEMRTVDIRPDGNIQRAEVRVCSGEKCLLVVMGHQRGAVHVLEEEED